MELIAPGKIAPPILLNMLGGQTMALKDALRKGPVVAAFFKVSCPTCQFSAPFWERLHETYGGGNFTLWGISQDNAADTRDFCKELDVDFPILIEDPGYSISNQYGITYVPSVFLISQDGKIEQASVGFSKVDLEHIASVAAASTSVKPTPLFKAGEDVPAIKPG